MGDIHLSDSIKQEIRNAVASGNEVTTHQHYLDFYGKPAAGYIIVDPDTGSGAYRITSGEDGGIIFSGFILAASIAFLSIGGGLLVAGVAMFAISSIAIIRVLKSLSVADGNAANAVLGKLLAILSAVMFVLPFLTGVALVGVVTGSVLAISGLLQAFDLLI